MTDGQTEIQTDRDKDIDTDTEADTDTERQTELLIDTETVDSTESKLMQKSQNTTFKHLHRVQEKIVYSISGITRLRSDRTMGHLMITSLQICRRLWQ